MRYATLICVLAFSMLTLSACGKKGHLYLPDAPAQPQRTSTAP